MPKYKISWGLSGGFGGIADEEIIEAKDQERADREAWYRACEYYESYEGMSGLRDIEQIMEEDEVDADAALLSYQDEREGWLEYYAEEQDA